MATDKKELSVYKDGVKRPYFVKAENVNLGTKENPEFLPERLASMADDIAELEEEIGDGGESTVTGIKVGNVPYNPNTQGVVDLSEPFGDKVDKETGKALIPSTDLAKLQSLPTADQLTQQLETKADDAEVVKSISVNGGSPQTPTDGNVNIEVSGGSSVDPATATPSMDGTAAVGSSAKYAREDHVHPHDTAKQDVINDIGAIRAGATNGATAVQPGALETALNDYYDKDETDAAISQAITQAAIEAIVGSGDFVITYDDENDIFDIALLIPAITIGDVAEFTAASPQKTVNIKGSNLKADIVLTVPTGWTASKTTLTQVNGAVDEDIMLTYTGSESGVASGALKATSGTLEVTKTLYYSQYGNQPTIIVDPSTLSFEAIGDQSQTKTVAVSKFNLTNAITVQSSSNKFTASLNAAEDTLTVTYQPAAGDSGTQNATITLTSGTASASVSVSGEVIVPSLSVSPASLDTFSGPAGSTTAAQQLTITGSNLVNDVTVTIPTGFGAERNGSAAASPITLAKADVMASGGVTLDIKSSGDSSHASGSISVSSNGATTQNVPVEWVETEVETEGGVYSRKVGYSSTNGTTPDVDIKFKITTLASEGVDGKVKVVMKNGAGDYADSAGAIYTNLKKVDIPSTITIGGNTYKVDEIGGYAFSSGNSLNKCPIETINFLSPCNVTVIANAAFRLSSSFKGTGVVDNINTLVFPSSIKTIGNGYEGTAVKKVIIPNEYPNGNSNGGVVNAFGPVGSWGHGITRFDFGTGVNSLSSNNWGYDTQIVDIVFRKNGVVAMTSWAMTQWVSSMGENQLTVHVPAALVETYKASDGSDTNWKSLYDAGKVNFVAIDSK